METKEQIKRFLITDIEKHAGILVDDCNANLMSLLDPLDFLYTLVNLEQDYSVNIQALFANRDYTFLTINTLAEVVAAQMINT